MRPQVNFVPGNRPAHRGIIQIHILVERDTCRLESRFRVLFKIPHRLNRKRNPRQLQATITGVFKCPGYLALKKIVACHFIEFAADLHLGNWERLHIFRLDRGDRHRLINENAVFIYVGEGNDEHGVGETFRVAAIDALHADYQRPKITFNAARRSFLPDTCSKIVSYTETGMSKGNLLIVVNVFSPDRGGGGAIFSDLAYGLAERGWDVTVRCAYPYYPEWTDKSGDNGIRIQRYDEKGIHVERYGLYIPRNPNSLWERLLYEASFLLSLARAWPRGGKFDAVMVFCPLVGAVAFAVVNKWIFRKPLWLNVQDLSADAAAASGIARGKGIIKALGGVQGLLFNRADVWSSISPVMIERLAKIRTRNQPIQYLPNWLNDSMAQALAALPSKLGRVVSTPPKLLYAGNIGTKQDLVRFLQALHQGEAPFSFRVHGNGGGADAVRDFIAAANDPRFTFGPFLDEAGFAQALHETDFFVITEKSGSGGSFIPCKMISGVASGSPILAVCDAESPLGQEMALAKCGPCLTWESLGDTPAILEQAASDGGTFQAWQAAALERAAFYHRDNVIARFDTAIATLIKEGPDALGSDF